MFLTHTVSMSISIALLVISMIGLWCSFRNIKFILAPGIISISIYTYIFYNVKLKLKNLPNDNLYLNPFALIVLCGSVPLGIFVGIFAFRQIKLVSRGLTSKQYNSISKEIILDKKKSKLKSENFRYGFNKELNFREKIHNIYMFLIKKKSLSLISMISDT